MNITKSKFTFRAYFLPIITIAFLAVSLFVLYDNLPIKIEALRWIDIYMACLFSFSILWLTFGELRQKMIIVELRNNSIHKRNFLGLNKEYSFRDFEGFQTSTISSKNGVYEYLYLIRDGKKIIKVSEFYHANYDELKEAISEKSKFINDIKFSLWDEVKEIFS